MFKRLMGTTALATACIAGGAMFASSADAQARLCPATATGTGNISNAMCNAVGVPVPFTATLNLDVQEIVQSNPGASNTSVNGVQANQGGPGSRGFGFFQDAWARFHFDAPTAGNNHMGFLFNLLLDSNQQPTTRNNDVAGAGNTVSVNNTFDHSPSQIDREYAYFNTPNWGIFQMGAGPTSSTATFPYTPGAGYGPPGPAAANTGVDGGIMTQAMSDPTAFAIDANNSTLGSDPYGMKAAMHVRWVTPNFLGSDADHGFRYDIAFAPDGRYHDEGNFRTDTAGASASNDVGESVPPTQTGQKQQMITNMALTWDELFGKQWELSAGLGWNHGFAKKGIATNVSTAHGVGAGGTIGVFNGFGQIPGIGQADSSHKANADENIFAVGGQAVWNGAITVGGTYTYQGKSFYPANSPVYDQYGHTHTTMPAQGFSVGAEYDWDRYQIGTWYQYTVAQGDATDYGYIQSNYIGLGGGIHILKGLKWFGEAVLYLDRNNHSAPAIFAGGCGGGGGNTANFGGGAVTGGDNACRRQSDGVVIATGLSMDC